VNYDFRTLSPADFEELSRDLLQVKLKRDLQSFKLGRDGGVDLYGSFNDSKKLIVQCKHYAESSVADLIRDLANDEVPKVRTLQPERYLVVTSKPLLKSDKEKIKDLFKPHIKSLSDVVGNEDINNWLRQNPTIERQHYKLWLSSTKLLSTILHSQLYNHTTASVDMLRHRIRTYVQSSSFQNAKRLLETHNYCVIAGVPGIGKTTLAEMLVYHYVSEGYEPVKLSRSVSDVFKVVDSTKPQVFYYDDFLGQTTLDMKLEKNEDSDLLDWLNVVKKSENIKFILTTREYILKHAKAVYEKLDRTNLDFPKCTVELKSYSEYQKAKILYNHLYFSEVPQTHIDELVKTRTYKTIIAHRNYNPRLISAMTDRLAVNRPNLPADKYPSEFINILDHPNEIWNHAYTKQMTSSAQEILQVLTTFPEEVFLDDLLEAYAHYSDSDLPVEAENVLEELEDNFIKFEKVEAGVLVSFHNPSIKDFMLDYVSSRKKLVWRLAEKARYFDQVERMLLASSDDGPEQQIKKVLESNKDKIVHLLFSKIIGGSSRVVHVSFEGGDPSPERRPKGLEEKARRLVLLSDGLGPDALAEVDKAISYAARFVQKGRVDSDDLLWLLRSINKSKQEFTSAPTLIEASKHYFTQLHWWHDYDQLLDYIELYPKKFTSAERKQFKEACRKDLESAIEDLASDYSTGDLERLRDDSGTFVSIARKFGLPDVKYEQAFELKERELEVAEYEPEPDHIDYEFGGRSEGDVDSLFMNLRK